jgi:acyl carrier protein
MQLTENDVISIMTEALSPRTSRLTIETTSKDLMEWDSMGHLAVLVSLDAALNGRAASVGALTSTKSVREIVQLLRRHELCS